MKVRAYVLIASVALLGMSAGSKKAKLTEGVNPGDLAPRIEFLGNDAKCQFPQPIRTLYIAQHFGRLTMRNRGLVTCNWRMRLTSLVRTKSRCVRSLWMRKNLFYRDGKD